MIHHYIFAANAKHANFYARQLGIGTINHPNVIYVHSVDLLWGLVKDETVEFHFYETFWNHPKYGEIMEYVRIIELTAPKKETQDGRE